MNEQTIKTLNTLFTKLSDIPDEPKLYHFKPYLPQGKITLLAAEPGTGKTKTVCAFIALITTGKPLFDIPCMTPGRVLVFSLEDSATDLKQTVLHCGGNPDNVIAVGEDEVSLALQEKIDLSFASPIVEQAIAYYHPVLVVFDPLQRYIGKNTDANVSTKTNQAFKHLEILSKRYGTSFLLVVHNAKSDNYSSLKQKVMGSVDILGNVRSAMSMVRDPEKPEDLLTIHIKSNNKLGKTIRSKIVSISGNEDYARVEWIGLEDYSEADYWKAVKHKAERENAAKITDEDSVVATIIQLIHDNPAGVRIRREDFASAVDVICNDVVEMPLDRIVKRYSFYMKERHSIVLSPKTSQTLRPYLIYGKEFCPTKSPDRCLCIYRLPGQKTASSGM